jgi:hypothetical protein
LNQEYYDTSQVKSYIRCFELRDGKLYCTWNFKKIIYNREHRKYIEDIINYGLIRYEKEFSNKYYGLPFFKLKNKVSLGLYNEFVKKV